MMTLSCNQCDKKVMILGNSGGPASPPPPPCPPVRWIRENTTINKEFIVLGHPVKTLRRPDPRQPLIKHAAQDFQYGHKEQDIKTNEEGQDRQVTRRQ